MSDDQAQDLNQPGHWLAHYTKAATAFEHIVPAGQLRMSPYHLLTAVVLGELFPTWQVAGARGVCEDAGVDLQKVVWVHGRPRCVPVDSFRPSGVTPAVRDTRATVGVRSPAVDGGSQR